MAWKPCLLDGRERVTRGMTRGFQWLCRSWAQTNQHHLPQHNGSTPQQQASTRGHKQLYGGPQHQPANRVLEERWAGGRESSRLPHATHTHTRTATISWYKCLAWHAVARATVLFPIGAVLVWVLCTPGAPAARPAASAWRLHSRPHVVVVDCIRQQRCHTWCCHVASHIPQST